MGKKSKIITYVGAFACAVTLTLSCNKGGDEPGPTPVEETWNVSFVSTTLTPVTPITKIGKTKDLSLTFTLTDPTDNEYRLPHEDEKAIFTITTGGTTTLDDDDFAYAVNDGGLTATLSVSHDKYAGDIVIKGEAIINTASITIAENDSLLGNNYFELITNPEEDDPTQWDIVTEVPTGKDFTAYLVVTDIGQEIYDFERLPSLGGIEIGGRKLNDRQYYYDHKTGEISIEGRYINGDIIISAVPGHVSVVMGAFGYSYFSEIPNVDLIYYGGDSDDLATFHNFGDNVATFNIEGSVTTEDAIDARENRIYDYSYAESDKDLDLTVSIKDEHYYSYNLPLPKDPFETPYAEQQYFDVIVGTYDEDEEEMEYEFIPTNKYEYTVSPDRKSAHFHLDDAYFSDADCIYLGVEPIKTAREIHYNLWYYDEDLGVNVPFPEEALLAYGDEQVYGTLYHYCGLGDNSYLIEGWASENINIGAYLDEDYGYAFPLDEDDDIADFEALGVTIGDFTTYDAADRGLQDLSVYVEYDRGDQLYLNANEDIFWSRVFIDTHSSSEIDPGPGDAFHPETEDYDIWDYGYTLHSDEWYSGWNFVNPFADIEIDVEVKPLVDVTTTDPHITVDPEIVVKDESLEVTLEIAENTTYDYENTFELPDTEPSDSYVTIDGDDVSVANCDYTKEVDGTVTLEIAGTYVDGDVEINLRAERTNYLVNLVGDTPSYIHCDDDDYVSVESLTSGLSKGFHLDGAGASGQKLTPYSVDSLVYNYASSTDITVAKENRTFTIDSETAYGYKGQGTLTTPDAYKPTDIVDADGVIEDMVIEVELNSQTTTHTISLTNWIYHPDVKEKDSVMHYQWTPTEYTEDDSTQLSDITIEITLLDAYSTWDMPTVQSVDLWVVGEDGQQHAPAYTTQTPDELGEKKWIITFTSDTFIGDIVMEVYSPTQPA